MADFISSHIMTVVINVMQFDSRVDLIKINEPVKQSII